MGLVESMAGTAKGLKAAAGDGGFFYLVTDAKGSNAALVVCGAKKDSDGKKTSRLGRSMLKAFKSEHGKCLFSEGRIEPGSSLVFLITKGSAKPGVIKRAFKQSTLLHDGVGKAVLGLLKGAKIRMDAPTSSGTATATVTAPEEPGEAGLKAWSEQPEVQEMIGALGLSPEEVAEVFEAEQAFARYAEVMPLSLEEDTALQEQLAETEALLDELSLGQEEVRKLARTDLDKALALEETLNEKRLELARRNATGSDPFASSSLSGPDQQALSAAVRAGMVLQQEQVTALRAEIASLREQLDRAPGDADLVAALTTQRNTLLEQLRGIEQQFTAMRT